MPLERAVPYRDALRSVFDIFICEVTNIILITNKKTKNNNKSEYNEYY